MLYRYLKNTILVLSLALLVAGCPEDVSCPGNTCINLGDNNNQWYYDSLRYTQMQYVDRNAGYRLELFEAQNEAEFIIYHNFGEVDTLLFKYEAKRTYDRECDEYFFKLTRLTLDSASQSKFNLVFNPNNFGCATLQRLP